MLDECHHLGLEPLGVNVLHRGHLQGNLDVRVPFQKWIGLSKPEKVKWKFFKKRLNLSKLYYVQLISVEIISCLLVDIENEGLSSSCGKPLSEEVPVWSEVTEGQTP